MNKDNVVFTSEKGALYNTDCLKLLPTLEDETFDCVFADPPFNLNKFYGQGINDNKKEFEYLEWSKEWLTQCVRLLKPGGSLFIYNIPKWNMLFGSFLYDLLDFRHWIAIDFKSSMPISGKLYPAHYGLLYFSKGKPTTFIRPKTPIFKCRKCGVSVKDYGGYKKHIESNGGVNLSDVWTDISPVRHKKYKNRESNELPEKLLERVLKISTLENDLILDPFGGSGTTYVVAERMNRRWLGCEIGDCKSTIERLGRQISTDYEDDKYRTDPRSNSILCGHFTSEWGSNRALANA